MQCCTHSEIRKNLLGPMCFLCCILFLQTYDLNDTFDSLKDMTSLKSISSRTRFMIRDIVDLWIDKWSPKILNCVVPEIIGESDVDSDDDDDDDYRINRRKWF